MTDDFVFRNLDVWRMEGLTQPFELRDLSPGINVIHGPNGVGKSRTARALSLAIWPKVDGRQVDGITAKILLGAREWVIRVDADAVRYQCQGSDVPPPSQLPAPEAQDRYKLELRDLLAGVGEDFARAILRESAGGYDLSAAAQELGIDRRPIRRSGREATALKDAVDAVRAAERKVADLLQQQGALDELVRRRDEARRADGEARRLHRAIEYKRAVEEHDRARERLAAFPTALKQLAGNELAILEDLRLQEESARNDRNIAARRHQQGQGQIDSTRLHGAAIEPARLAAMEERRRQLDELSQQAAGLDGDVRAAVGRRDRLAAALAPAPPEKLARVDLSQVARAAELARQAERARGDLAALRQLRQWVGDLSQTGDMAPLSQGLSLLHRWLRVPDTPTGEAGPAWPPLGLAAIVVVLATALAWVWHWWVAAVAALGPVLYFAARTRRTAPPAADFIRRDVRDEYLKLGLPQPRAWAPQEVEATARQLVDSISRAQAAHEKADRWRDLPDRERQAEQVLGELAGARNQLADEIGVAPKIDEAVLHALVGSLVEWQQADADAAAKSNEHHGMSEECDRLLKALAAELSAFGYHPTDRAALAADIADLRRRADELRTAARELRAADEAIASANARLTDVTAKIEALFSNLGISDRDAQVLRGWIEQRPAYMEHRTTVDVAEARATELRAEVDGPLGSLPIEDLETRLKEFRDRAAEEQSLIEQVARIERDIEVAKQSSALEEALANRAEAEHALGAVRQADCDAAAGWVLAEHLRQVSRERRRPEVFRRARDLFARITRGRYLLEFDESDPPAFRAIDTATQLGQSLEELSGGTRVQLLLAVRLAFVEQQEQAIKLPLVFDEALANSDESRARQIIEATLEIGRTGRQIFYFTAQPDEVAKWQEMLSVAEGVMYKLIDLAAARNLAETERTPLRQMVTPSPPEVPSPDGYSNIEYGKLLNISNAIPESIGSIHLWYLLDDMGVLHRLLKLGVKCWGQWRTLKETTGAVAGLTDGFDAAAARARALEHLLRLWRVGRGRPVDRRVLADSQLVSEAFLDPVAKLLDEVGGDAPKLMDRLENRAVPRFRSNTVEQLRQYLTDNGYLDERPSLSAEDLRVHALAMAARDIESGLLSNRHIDEYIARWFQ